MSGKPQNPTTLKSCPFCGARNHRVSEPKIIADMLTEQLTRIVCLICGARTKQVQSKLEAINAWNQRARR